MMITLPNSLVVRLEALAEESLRAMETANTAADESIYTSSSMSAAFATLEELREEMGREADTNQGTR